MGDLGLWQGQARLISQAMRKIIRQHRQSGCTVILPEPVTPTNVGVT